MIKYFGRAFKITNENIILTTPLVLFILLFAIYTQITQNAPPTVAAFVLLLITTLFMFGAFFAGWFFIARRAIELDKQEFIIDEDKAKASLSLIKEFPVGVGEYFLPFVGGLILYAGLFLLILTAAYFIGMHYIGNVGLSLNDLRVGLESPVALKSLVASLTLEQTKKLNAWNLLFMTVMTTYSFITMFFGAQIVFGTKNPLVAFFKSIKFITKNFLGSLVLFIYINIVSFVVSLLINVLSVTISPKLSVISFIVYLGSMLLYFYFVVYVVVLIFLYYDRENTKGLKIENISPDGKLCDCESCDCAEDSADNSPEIDSEDDAEGSSDNSVSGPDSVGEEHSGDSDSERN